MLVDSSSTSKPDLGGILKQLKGENKSCSKGLNIFPYALLMIPVFAFNKYNKQYHAVLHHH
jgi:hypothetical protein